MGGNDGGGQGVTSKEGAANVAEKLRQVKQRESESDRKLYDWPSKLS